MCDGACVNLKNDQNNCGSCGNACGNDTCCGGSCKDLSGDYDNCGSCGHGCGFPDTGCSGGECCVLGAVGVCL
jgi:hypothetical protein